ncbi:MAG TPA: hypothetical protein VNX70_00345 [Bryobacteraceae bacterium]|nr:hypothetical protein [Bryobacteraceae bacterium]
MSRFFFSIMLASLVFAIPSMGASVPSVVPMIQTGYHQMYNLEFDGAHKTFAQFEQQRPDDPLGHVSNAAAYLFAEFDRLNILQSEFFVNDDRFRHAKRLTPDPAVRQAFDGELAKAEQLANGILARSPQDPDALFANILSMGLRADYSALVEKRYLDSLRVIKNGRETAEKLLAIAPDYYDAYLAIGVENYMLSLKAAPVRWLLSLGGAQVDRERGIQDLRLTAEKGHYLSPYARLLLAVAAMRNKDRAQARDLLTALVHDFPHNKLYSEELARLQ